MADSEKAPRVLLCGDVEGKLDLMFGRVAAVSKSNGPFDALFCVGPFFPTSSSAGTSQEIQDYISGSKTVPIPTYFIGDYGEGATECLASVLAEHIESEGSGNKGSGDRGLLVCENLRWLRGSGVVEICGLQVAYLSGQYSAPLFPLPEGLVDIGVQRRGQVERLVDAAAQLDAAVDFLLTNEWPMGILSGLPPTALPAGVNPRTVGSPVAAELAREIRPRYHVSGTSGAFFQRPPYLSGSPPGSANHVVRFLGLAPLGNPGKLKALHALNPTPARRMAATPGALLPPPGTTPSPFPAAGPEPSLNPGKPEWAKRAEEEEAGGGAGAGVQHWRYAQGGGKRQRVEGSGGAAVPPGVCFDFVVRGGCERGSGSCRFRHDEALRAEREERGRGGGAQGSGPRGPEGAPRGVCYDWFKTQACGRGADCRYRHTLDPPSASSSAPASAPAPCWFCLSSPAVESHLVASVGDHAYVALAKGPLTPGHCLVLPIEHFPAVASLPSDVAREIYGYRDAMHKCWQAENKSTLIFERFLKLRAGTHAHVQIVPIPERHVANAQSVFEAAAKKAGIEFQALPEGLSHQAEMDELKRISLGGNYFCIRLPSGATFACGIPEGFKFPMQFGREVAAELLEKPERADWRECKLSKEEEVSMVESFKKRFKAYDIM